MADPGSTLVTGTWSRVLLVRRWAPWSRALVFAGIAVVVAVVADRWHAGIRRAQAAAVVTERLHTYRDALHGAVERRVRLLAGLRSFAQSRRSRAQLDDEFPLFAQGTLTGLVGVRALQFVEDGRIVATWPIRGNEAALGYDLMSDPRPELGADVRRALASGLVTVTGPVALVQGGTGLLVRQRLNPREGFPQLAAIILDVPTLVREAGIPNPNSGLRIEVFDRAGQWFAGDPAGSAVDPERLPVDVEDGDWTLAAAPTDGWGALTAGPARDFRVAAAAIVVAVGLLGFLVGSRERELAGAAVDAGSQRDLALRAGRMGTWQWDVRTNRVAWSESAVRILGFDARAQPDPITRYFEAVHPDDRAMVRTVVASTARGERDEYTIEYRVRQSDGGYRWVVAIGELERDPSGAPAVLEGVLSDATERRALEERLHQVDRMEALGQLASGVAHDFNNLLTAMQGFAELARNRADSVKDDAAAREIREDLDQVLAIAGRGSAITAQLLAFSRRAPVAPRPIDLSAAVREVAPMLSRLLTSRVEMVTELADGLPMLLMDPGQCTQVLMNLLVNARDAMPDGGRVTVRTLVREPGDPAVPADGPKGRTVVLEVEDRGTGMTEEVKRRMFEPFFTTKEKGRGTGLGLPVVLAAVETAGGVLTVESALGEGTTFRAFFPAIST